MVVTTKQTKPTIPAVPSRSASSTATPKAAKRASLNVKPATSIPARPLQESTQLEASVPPAVRAPAPAPLPTNTRHDASGPFADDVKFLASPKKTTKRLVKRAPAKRPSRVHKKKKTRQWTELIELLTKITFLLFSIYSLLVCPRDAQLQSPVCRGLDHYRRTIVDPYILPPLRAAVTHPAVAPHIERAKPYVDQAVDTVKTQYHIAHDKVAIAAQPYVIMAQQEYKVRLRPHVRLMEYNLRRYHRRAQPYINLFQAKAIQTWARIQIQAEPYVTPLLLKLEQAPIFVKNFIQKPLEEGKEKWVDPQVKKIVDKVHEMNAAAASTEPVAASTYYSLPAPEATTAQSPDPEPTADPLDQQLRNPRYDEDVEDIEFWQDLDKWLSEAILTTNTGESATPTSLPPKPTRLTDEEKAEKKRKELEETAIKRKDIMARHDKWEHNLEALIDSEYKKLSHDLEAIRKKAHKELVAHPKIVEEVEKMSTELDASIKYSQFTLDKLREEWEDRYGEMDEDWKDHLPRWTNVLESIERNFARRAELVQRELAAWVPTWMTEESELIRKASEAVSQFADKAQADLISDYAWLMDVTYRDWERYHKLMFRGREAKDIFQKLAQVEKTVLGNPVHDHLVDLGKKITHLQEAYDAGIEKIRREGWKYILGEHFDEHAEMPKHNAAKDFAKYNTEEHIKVPEPQKPYPDVGVEDAEGHPFIGKSKEQVHQAAEAAGIHHEHDHEEL